MITWGQPRFTADLDTLVQVRESQDKAFASALAEEGLRLDVRDLASARADPGHVSIFDERSQFHLDVKLASTAAELDQIEAAHSVSLGEKTLRVASPEDTIAFKVAYGSPQDLQDARSIMIRQLERMDLDRLRRTAHRLDVLDPVEAMLLEAQRDEA